ncbi:hypothetical protein S83_029641 [Arachis hypogaea]
MVCEYDYDYEIHCMCVCIGEIGILSKFSFSGSLSEFSNTDKVSSPSVKYRKTRDSTSSPTTLICHCFCGLSCHWGCRHEEHVSVTLLPSGTKGLSCPLTLSICF